METPRVSVLMTAYNREKYITAAIESVLASTYTDFELIIVDDCSTDTTVQIAASFADKDKRVKLFINEKNIGQFDNRNLAAKYATGIYLKYLDSDDLIYPHGLGILVETMDKYPDAGYGLCSLEQDIARIFPFMLTPEETYYRHFCEKESVFHKAPLSSIIRKDAFVEVGGFTNPHGEGDYEMWLSLSTQYNIVLMPHGIVWYRMHDEQIDFQRRNNRFLQFRYFLVTEKYLNTKNCPLPESQRKIILQKTKGTMIKYSIMTFLRYSPSQFIQMYKLAGYTFFDFIKQGFMALVVN